MAKDNGASADKKDPVYIVAEVTAPGKLEVIEWEVSAKNQEAAQDKVVAALPAERKAIRTAAFLRRGYEEIEYEPEVTTTLKKKKAGVLVDDSGEKPDPDVSGLGV